MGKAIKRQWIKRRKKLAQWYILCFLTTIIGLY
jgi:hypothetical protein